MDEIIKKLKNKQNLSFEESQSAFEDMMTGKVNEDQIHDNHFDLQWNFYKQLRWDIL